MAQCPKYLFVAVYVDDLLVTGSSIKNILNFKKQMKSEFDMNLGLEVNQKKGFTKVKQTSYGK